MLKKTSGLVVSIVVALIAFTLSYIHPSFDALVISIILAMLFSNLLRDREFLNEGIKLSLKIFLPIGIALYGAQLTIKEIDPVITPLILITYVIIFSLVYFIAKAFGIKNSTRILLATGMSTCGASAIAIVSPLIKSEGEETSISLIVVMTYGLFGMITYPLFASFLGLGVKELAFIAGTTLPMLGQVKVAASTSGAECLALALRYKLLRISFLVFLVTLTIFLSKREGRRIYIPWFVAVFVVLALLVNVFNLDRFSELSEPVSRFSLSTALAAIGLSVNFESITEEGIKPLAAVFLSLMLTLIAVFFLLYITKV